MLLSKSLNECLIVLSELCELNEIDLGEYDHEGLGLEQGLDVLEQGDLLFDGISASLGYINEVEDASVQMSKSCDTLHFDSVTFIEGVIEHSWGIDDLPSGVLVVGVTYEQGLGGESVGLDIDVGISNVVHEGGFTDIRITCDDKCPGISIDLRQSTHVLSDFFKIGQTALKFLDESTNSTECSSLQLFDSV